MVCRHKRPIWPPATFVSSCCPYDIDDVARDLAGINILDKVMEGALQRGMADWFLNIPGRSASNDSTLAEYEEVRADLLNHFQHVRAVENRLSLLTQSPDQVLENKGGRDIQPGKRLIENQQLRIV